MRIRCHFDVTMLIYKHFAVFFKNNTYESSTHRNLFKTVNGNFRRRRGAQISYLRLFQSGLTPIDTYCQIKSTERYKNVSRALAYTWHGRLSDGSTYDNTSHGRPKYKNFRIVKSVPDTIDCD